MFSSHLLRLPMFMGFLTCLIFLTSSVQAEDLEGFRDLKFGMTENDVLALESCSTSSECLIELAGKNRYLLPFYSQTSDKNSQPILTKITIDMGRFSDEWYQELQVRLQDQYRLTHDLRSEDISAFQNEQQSELTSGYENGQILLKVVRRKFGNLVLKVIYQNKDMAAETLKHIHNSP